MNTTTETIAERYADAYIRLNDSKANRDDLTVMFGHAIAEATAAKDAEIETLKKCLNGVFDAEQKQAERSASPSNEKS